MNIAKRMEIIRNLVDGPGGGNVGEEIQKLAVKALAGGISSNDWRAYAAVFCSNNAQLARLTGNDGFTARPDGYGLVAVTYVMSDGVCGGPTTGGMGLDIPAPFMRLLEDGLPENTEAGFGTILGTELSKIGPEFLPA